MAIFAPYLERCCLRFATPPASSTPRLANALASVRPLAAPLQALIGGITVSFLMELLIYPVIFYLWKRRQLRREWVAPARIAGV